MARKSWVKELSDKGYKYMVYHNGEVYVTKADKINDTFNDDSDWDVYEFEEGENWTKNRKPGVFYSI